MYTVQWNQQQTTISMQQISFSFTIHIEVEENSTAFDIDITKSARCRVYIIVHNGTHILATSITP
jgi:uncharacterized OsmC-like protein